MSFLEAAGAQVALVSPDTSLDEFCMLMTSCQGFLVPGGNSIESWRYGGALQQRADDDPPVPQRDEFELAATKWVVSNGIPFLGICRGLQVLNVACGGTLQQELPARTINHWPSNDMTLIAHQVAFERNGLLARALSCDQAAVNSLHHQAIDRLGEGLVVEARAADDVIEAARVKSHPFAVGVQWHPEGVASSAQSVLLARAFVAACSKGPQRP